MSLHATVLAKAQAMAGADERVERPGRGNRLPAGHQSALLVKHTGTKALARPAKIVSWRSGSS